MEKYITQLTNDEIEAFFLVNGYKLCKDLTTDDGEPLDAIERSDDAVMVRAKQIEKDTIIDQVDNTSSDTKFDKNKSHLFAIIYAMSALGGEYSTNIDLIHFSDFYLSKFCFYPEDEKESEKLCTSYIQWMNSKFPTYKADFNAYCDKLLAESPEEETTL